MKIQVQIYTCEYERHVLDLASTGPRSRQRFIGTPGSQEKITFQQEPSSGSQERITSKSFLEIRKNDDKNMQQKKTFFPFSELDPTILIKKILLQIFRVQNAKKW